MARSADLVTPSDVFFWFISWGVALIIVTFFVYSIAKYKRKYREFDPVPTYTTEDREKYWIFKKIMS